MFCYDHLLCPIQKRILQAAGAREIPTKPVIVGAPTVQNTIALAGVLLQRRRIIGSTSEEEEATMATSIRMCSEPNCDKKLSCNNLTGKCQVHAASAHRPQAEASGNGHAGNDHGNGHTKGNGHAHPPSNGHDVLLEERLALVMSRIPIAERLAFVDRWLRAEA